jgi:hypothetical protein
MEFRWVAAITLWTMLAGPVFGPGAYVPSSKPQKKAAIPTKGRPKDAPRPTVQGDGGRG